MRNLVMKGEMLLNDIMRAHSIEKDDRDEIRRILETDNKPKITIQLIDGSTKVKMVEFINVPCDIMVTELGKGVSTDFAYRIKGCCD